MAVLKTLKDENNALFANHHERSEVLRETPVIKIIYLNFNFDTVSVTETNNEGLLIVMMISFNGIFNKDRCRFLTSLMIAIAMIVTRTITVLV